ncbi:MAG: winged helix-turn-helix domain-containing protein [Candidatus Nitrosocaldus sp.]
MNISTGVSIEDVMLMVIAYIAGMIITSLIIKDRYSNRQDSNPYEAYEHVIADLIARMDVIDLRMKRIDDVTGSLYRGGSHPKDIGKRDDVMLINDIKHDDNNNDNNSNNNDYKSSTSMVNASSMMKDNIMITNKADDDDTRRGGEGGMDGGMLTIISSYRNASNAVMEGMNKGEIIHINESNSTIERVLSMMREGSKTSREIEKRLGMSREHTARLMKRLYEMGYVTRDKSKRPYRYMLAQSISASNSTVNR